MIEVELTSAQRAKCESSRRYGELATPQEHARSLRALVLNDFLDVYGVRPRVTARGRVNP